jgi:hypothetical protein
VQRGAGAVGWQGRHSGQRESAVRYFEARVASGEAEGALCGQVQQSQVHPKMHPNRVFSDFVGSKSERRKCEEWLCCSDFIDRLGLRKDPQCPIS